jgi:hypothetical protein
MVDGIDIWRHSWYRTGEVVVVGAWLFSSGERTHVSEVRLPNRVIRFSAIEQSACVYRIYVPRKPGGW